MLQLVVCFSGQTLQHFHFHFFSAFIQSKREAEAYRTLDQPYATALWY